MNPSLRADVRSVMLNFAAAGLAFDANRVALKLGAQTSDVAPEVEYTFWDGALMPFAYRRQARTGLSPLYTSSTGELPGVFAEGRPSDARPPESMPRDWI